MAAITWIKRWMKRRTTISWEKRRSKRGLAGVSWIKRLGTKGTTAISWIKRVGSNVLG